MSLLLFGVQSRTRIGVAASQYLALGNHYGSAVHTISSSAPTRPQAGHGENTRYITTAAQPVAWKATMAKQFSSSSANGARPWISSSPAAAFLAQTTRTLSTEGGDFRDSTLPPGTLGGCGVSRVPTLAYAQKMPKTFPAMTNDQVLHFAELGIPEACRECIVRDIMVVDQVEHEEAMETFQKVAATNREGMLIAALPFYLGFGAAFGGHS